MTELTDIPCRAEAGGTPDNWWSTDQATVEAAAAQCRACPLISMCRDMGADETVGVWGGQVKHRTYTSGRGGRKAQTHCRRGHEFTLENTVSNGVKGRSCRTCRALTYARYNASRAA